MRDAGARGARRASTAEQAARLVVAYEPIWAIGTGRTPRPRRPTTSRARSARRSGALFGPPAAMQLRVLYGGSVKPENAALFFAEPDIDGALVGGAALEADSFADIVAAPRSRTTRPDARDEPARALIIMDGFGRRRGRARATPSRWRRRRNLDELFARVAAHALDCVRARGRAARGPDGQLRGRPPQHRRRPRRLPGAHPHQPRDRGRLAVREPGAGRGDRRGASPTGGAVHLMGLVSDGGVHSHIEHLYALSNGAGARRRATCRALLPRRPRRAARERARLRRRTLEAVLRRARRRARSRRSWAATTRWTATTAGSGSSSAWRALVLGEGVARRSAPMPSIASLRRAASPTSSSSPAVVGARAASRDGDAVIFFNFRPDRAREITRAFVDPDLRRASSGRCCPQLHFVCLTEYDPTIPAPVAFPKDLPEHVLADVLAEHGLRQLHIAETEKYAHVTFFLNGGAEPPKPGEERVLVPSPKVATYDLQPEMSAPEVTARARRGDRGRTGRRLHRQLRELRHGRAHRRLRRGRQGGRGGRRRRRARGRGRSAPGAVSRSSPPTTATPSAWSTRTARRRSPRTPPIARAADRGRRRRRRRSPTGGMLADVAPTLLDLIGIAEPAEWTGRSLLLY